MGDARVIRPRQGRYGIWIFYPQLHRFALYWGLSLLNAFGVFGIPARQGKKDSVCRQVAHPTVIRQLPLLGFNFSYRVACAGNNSENI
jgi:hypothetical protein